MVKFVSLAPRKVVAKSAAIGNRHSFLIIASLLLVLYVSPLSIVVVFTPEIKRFSKQPARHLDYQNYFA